MAVNQQSPGVVFQERDLTSVTQVSSPNTALVAGPFQKGPVEEMVTITNERGLVEVFGEPNEYNYEYWYTAAQFLDYGGVLKTVRLDDDVLKNACDKGTAPKIKNFDDYEANFEASNNTFDWVAREAGSLGNSIGIFVTDAGPDQILKLDAPSSGNDWEFTKDAAVTGASGAAGKVFNYSVVLTLTSVVGTFTDGETVNIDISGSDQATTVKSWDPATKKLELAVGSITGIIAAAQTLAGATSSATATIATGGVERKLYVILDKGSVSFTTTDTPADTQSDAAAILSLSDEYLERQYLPGVKWIQAAPRPGTSEWAANAGGHNDELNIIVVDVDGKITGTVGQVLERFVGLSKASDARTPVGETNYYPSVIKARSRFIYWGEHEDDTNLHAPSGTASEGQLGLAGSTTFNVLRSTAGTVNHPAGLVTPFTKEGSTMYYRLGAASGTAGVDYTVSGVDYSVTAGKITTAYELADDPEDVLIDFILAGPSGATDDAAVAKISALVALAEERMDAIVFASPRRGTVVGIPTKSTQTTNIIDFANKLPSSSYMVLDSGYKYIYDKYNDVYRFVPCNGDIAGLCLETTEDYETWFSPAGLNRGILRNVVRLAYTPNRNQRDQLYNARVNPVVAFPGQGAVLFGDKTALGRPSAFDRINVRRLFIQLERVITNAAKTQLFEQNDEQQRQLFVNLIEPYLRDVQGRRGIQDFTVKCDEDNNPPDAVDRGEFYAEIFVQPTRAINFISLTFVATRQGINFEELV